MTLRKPFLLLWCLCALAISASAGQVTFQVDMSFQIDNRGFSPANDRLEVRGPFNNWTGGPAWTLTPSGPGLQVYAGTFNIPGNTGDTIPYKFWRTPDQWESIAGNRSFTMEAGAQTLPVVFFSDDRGVQPVTASVTFKVNMATQIAAGNFNPGAGDFVVASGEFNNWGSSLGLAPDPVETNIFVGTMSMTRAPGATVQFKYNMQRGLTGRSVVWEGAQATPSGNREFVFSGEEQILDPVYFDNVTGVPIKAVINFAVNMNAQIAGGRFDPASQEVYVRGNKFGWGNPPEGLKLEQDSSRPGIYTNTFKADNILTGESIDFKVTMWNFVSSSVIWEGGTDKHIIFNGTEPLVGQYHVINYGPAYFDNVTPADILTADTLVTFRVNMTNAARLGGAAFNPATEGVWINGSFLPNGWATWNVQASDRLMFDDGQSGGDAVAGDRVYTVQYFLPRGSASRLEYKYGINAGDNEAGANTNHVRYVRGPGTFVLPVDTFGVMTQEPSFGALTATRGANGHVILNWLGRPGVRLQKLGALGTGVGEDIVSTDGKSSYDYTMDGNAVFFRLVQLP